MAALFKHHFKLLVTEVHECWNALSSAEKGSGRTPAPLILKKKRNKRDKASIKMPSLRASAIRLVVQDWLLPTFNNGFCLLIMKFLGH